MTAFYALGLEQLYYFGALFFHHPTCLSPTKKEGGKGKRTVGFIAECLIRMWEINKRTNRKKKREMNSAYMMNAPSYYFKIQILN
jgi:hypothetical protein